MGESYTIGYDTLDITDKNTVLAQTFTPLEDFTLFYSDLYTNALIPKYDLGTLLFPVDANGFPIWNILSKALGPYTSLVWGTLSALTRFRMEAYDCKAGTPYCLALYHDVPLGVQGIMWWYDRNDAKYPRGMKLRYNVQTDTWTKYPNDDFYFAVWGTPSLPVPDPTPPINKWGLTTHDMKNLVDGYLITTRTSVPCHKYLAWTNNPLLKHKTPIMRRGAYWKDAVRLCFTKWFIIEQNEEGDTDKHTFNFIPWPVCQTRWWTYLSTIHGYFATSVGPVFELHRESEGAEIMVKPIAQMPIFVPVKPTNPNIRVSKIRIL